MRGFLVIEDYFIHFEKQIREIYILFKGPTDLKKKKKSRARYTGAYLLFSSLRGQRQTDLCELNGQPSLNRKLWVSQGFIVRPWRKRKIRGKGEEKAGKEQRRA